MSYRKVSLLVSIFFTSLHATPCNTPAVADDNLSKTFRYGCFCGEHYPNIKHPSNISYKELNTTARQGLMEQYKQIDAYDSIDEACKVHDICFIEEGKEAKVCNDAIIERLTKIKDEFSKEADDNVTNAQCRDLAFDIASVFHTIFSPADDEDSIFDFGMLMVNGAITTSNKMGQEAADTLSDNAPRYPAKGIKCLLDSLKKSKKEVTSVKSIKKKPQLNNKADKESSYTLDVSNI